MAFQRTIGIIIVLEEYTLLHPITEMKPVTNQLEIKEGSANPLKLEIFVASHCPVCDYTKEIYELIRQRFPAVTVKLISIDQPDVLIPEVVFATPTYLLNGKIWSLGNPSQEQIERTFGTDKRI